jgi:hypothetical protein
MKGNCLPRKSAAVPTDTVQTTRTGAAERMRRSRTRRRSGLRRYTLELRDTEIQALDALGLLAPGEETR